MGTSGDQHGPVVVLATHLPGEGHFTSERFHVQPWLCVDSLDYWQAWESVWHSDATIVNVEHDIEATDELIQQLIDCPNDLCSGAYRCNWISTGIPHGVIACGSGDRATSPELLTYHSGGEQWADWSAIGLVKITPNAKIKGLAPRPWQFLELSIEESVKRPWHVHWGADPLDGRPVEYVNHWHY